MNKVKNFLELKKLSLKETIRGRPFSDTKETI